MLARMTADTPARTALRGPSARRQTEFTAMFLTFILSTIACFRRLAADLEFTRPRTPLEGVA
jgi:hypothetical protein